MLRTTTRYVACTALLLGALGTGTATALPERCRNEPEPGDIYREPLAALGVGVDTGTSGVMGAISFCVGVGASDAAVTVDLDWALSVGGVLELDVEVDVCNDVVTGTWQCTKVLRDTGVVGGGLGTDLGIEVDGTVVARLRQTRGMAVSVNPVYVDTGYDLVTPGATYPLCVEPGTATVCPP